ncbi:MAG: stage III sporulation protein AF [Firmicutes bacterium]|nr:stage III sporulation protein AF [Bacillota bacterium]
MKGYIMSVCMAAVIASLADILAPREHQKYIRVLLGFLILTVILSPLPKVKKIKFEPIENQTLENTKILSDNISVKLKENVEADIFERIKGEFGVICDADVLLDIDDEHKIRGVKRIALSKKIPENALERLKEVYGCDRIEYKVK